MEILHTHKDDYCTLGDTGNHVRVPEEVSIESSHPMTTLVITRDRRTPCEELNCVSAADSRQSSSREEISRDRPHAIYQEHDAAAVSAGVGASVSISNTSSLPEVIGDAGRLIDPHDVSDALRTDLKQCCLDRTAVFTRERIAAQTLAVYRVITGVW